jgi:transcriptional regulator with XRE-family HTH domain
MDGAELRKLRTRLGFTQAELAGEVDVSPNTVARWERGVTPIPVAVAKLVGLLAETVSPATALSWRHASLRDPHHQAIVEALNGELDDKVFEACAADLLRKEWPGLVPVRGGSDDGFDGVVAGPGEEPFPLITTVGSAGTSNLERNLKRALSRGWHPRRAVFATSRRIRSATRKKLFDLARKLGVELAQAYEQDWFANALYHDPTWCKKLLNVSGRPSALAVVPLTRRPIVGDRVVGRERELAALRSLDHDCLVEGVPGSGKTFLLRALCLEGRAHFLIDPDREALANAIRSQRPFAIIVDDAHISPDSLAELAHLRKQIHANFVIIAVSWPGGAQAVRSALQLRPSDTVTLDLIDRDTMVEVIKSVGIHGPNPLIRNLVLQAEGRPGLAATLAYLCMRGDIQDVVLGEAIGDQIGAFLSQLVGPRYGTLLGAFALGGSAGAKAEIVSSFLGVSKIDLQTDLSSLAAAGVVRELRDGAISVSPEPFRWVLVRNTFFRPFRVCDYRSLLAQLPNRKEAVETLLGAYSRGAVIPELEDLVEEIGSQELWAEYASLGRNEATRVLGRRPELVVAIAGAGLEHVPSKTIPMLLDQAVGEEGPHRGSPNNALPKIEVWATGAHPNAVDVVSRRRLLVEATVKWLEASGETAVALKALCLALKPGFEFNEADPGRGRTVTLTWGILRPQDLSEIGTLWPATFGVIKTATTVPWLSIIDLVQRWVQPDVRVRISEETRETTHSVAERMLQDLLASSQAHPGVQHRLAEMADRASIKIPVVIDSDFEQLYPRNVDDYEDLHREAQREVQNLASVWISNGMEWSVSRLSWIEEEASMAGVSYPSRTYSLCRELAHAVPDPGSWARHLVAANLGPSLVEPFLFRAVIEDQSRSIELLQQCFDSENYRGIAVGIVFRMPDPSEGLIAAAVRYAAEFVQLVKAFCWSEHVSESLLHRLLVSEDEGVALAAVIGEWRSEPAKSVRESVAREWRLAVLRSSANDHWLGEILANEPDLAKEWLIARAREADRFSFLRFDRVVGRAISTLDKAGKIEVLRHVQPGYRKDQLVRELVADDLDVYRELLATAELSRYHLAPLEGRPDGQWVCKAIMALDTGYEANDVFAAALPSTWSWTGEESAHWARQAAEFESLCSHVDRRIAKIGEIGATAMRERVSACLAEERLESV